MMGNMGGMMKKVQEMQAKMQEMQKELENKTVEAESGGGMVKVTMNGKQVVQSINIDPSLLSEDEKEVLEDLIKAALNQAKEKVEEMSAEEMKKLTGGLPLPPGMKREFAGKVPSWLPQATASTLAQTINLQENSQAKCQAGYFKQSLQS